MSQLHSNLLEFGFLLHSLNHRLMSLLDHLRMILMKSKSNLNLIYRVLLNIYLVSTKSLQNPLKFAYTPSDHISSSFFSLFTYQPFPFLLLIHHITLLRLLQLSIRVLFCLLSFFLLQQFWFLDFSFRFFISDYICSNKERNLLCLKILENTFLYSASIQVVLRISVYVDLFLSPSFEPPFNPSKTKVTVTSRKFLIHLLKIESSFILTF